MTCWAGHFLSSPICYKHLLQPHHAPSFSEWRHSTGLAVITIPARVFSGFLCDNKHKRNVFGGSLTETPYICHASATERKAVENRRSWRDAKVEIFYSFFVLVTHVTKERCTRVSGSHKLSENKDTCFKFVSSFEIIMGCTVSSRGQLKCDGTR